MKKVYRASRKSHCGICGNRLSSITAGGRIAWQPSRIDDNGIYCIACAAARRAPHERTGDHQWPRP